MVRGNKINAVLFDFDGVLIESFDTWHAAFNDTLERFKGESITKDEFRKRYWGPPVETSMKMLGLGEEEADYCRNRYLKRADEGELVSGAKQVLESIDNQIGLVTNMVLKTAMSRLEHFNLREYFEVVITGSDVENLKPEPDPILKACSILEVDPSEVIYVGDTEADVQATREAGCLMVGIGVDGDFRIDDLVELPDLLFRLKD